MLELHATTHACSRSSTKVENTPVVRESNPNGPGAPLLLVMMQINCGVTVVAVEVRIILTNIKPTLHLFVF